MKMYARPLTIQRERRQRRDPAAVLTAASRWGAGGRPHSESKPRSTGLT